jgi:hypothetical protein
MAGSLGKKAVAGVVLGGLSAGLPCRSVEAGQGPGKPSGRALAVFQQVGTSSAEAFLEGLRPRPLAPHLRAQVMASLPAEGEVRASEKETRKLAAIEPILDYHRRRDVLQLKLITVGHAFVGLHARTVLLVSREALDLVDAPELQALIAHEMGHEYFWDEYAAAMATGDRDKVQELELRCDGVAVLTLRELGLEAAALVRAVTALTRFNERIGAMASAGSYTSLKDRIAFVKELDGLMAGPAEPVNLTLSGTPRP